MDVRGQYHTTTASSTPAPGGKQTRYPLNRRLREPQSLSGHFGEDKKFSLVGMRNPDYPDLRQVATPTAISGLGSNNNNNNKSK